MAGLIDLAGGEDGSGPDPLERTRASWEVSMLAQLDPLRTSLRLEPPSRVARRCGAENRESGLQLAYWGDDVSVAWPDMLPLRPDGTELSTFDSAMVLYYLSRADGLAPTGKWIGFRELPEGAFYHQAFQSYSGDRICRGFEADPEALRRCAGAIGGWPVSDLGDQAFAFQPLPLIRLAAVLWLGDDEVPSRAAVLFDEAASHHHPTDGLALLGSGLTRRLLRQAERDRAEPSGKG
jgi:hypothetical protein